jgi:DNA-binding LytR/AlgR family response regulator
LRIAICDDNRQDIETLRDDLIRIIGNAVIDTYETGKAFLTAAKQQRYDLVFMDIYLEAENGIDIIKEMRKISPGTQTVFLTVSDTHAVEAFSVRAIHYLVKPYRPEDIAEAVKRAEMLNLSDLPESMLTIRIGSGIYTLSQNDIIRVEASDHKTNIFMKNGSVYSVWMPFSKVEPQLDKNFLTIKRGVAIHMRYVKKWGTQDCEMIDGTQYLLNRSARQQLKEAYFTYKMQEMSGSSRVVPQEKLHDDQEGLSP